MIKKLVTLTKIAFKQYLKFFYVVIGFALSLFAIVSLVLSKSFEIFSGNLTLNELTVTSILISLILILVITIINSFFVTMLIFLVRRNLSQGYNRVYLLEILRKHWHQIFLFNLGLNVLLFILFLILKPIGIGFLLPIWYIIILLPLMFVDQAILIDELGIRKAIKLSYYFFKNNPFKVAYIILITFVLFLVSTLISYYIPEGYFLGIILTNVVVYPIYLIVRTVVYLTKFKILDSYF